MTLIIFLTERAVLDKLTRLYRAYSNKSFHDQANDHAAHVREALLGNRYTTRLPSKIFAVDTHRLGLIDAQAEDRDTKL
jgi:hypothetical protein